MNFVNDLEVSKFALSKFEPSLVVASEVWLRRREG